MPPNRRFGGVPCPQIWCLRPQPAIWASRNGSFACGRRHHQRRRRRPTSGRNRNGRPPTGRPMRGRRPEPLDVDDVDGPVLGVKLAAVRGAGRPELAPIAGSARHRNGARRPESARCRRGHAAPAIECSCGWHAVRSPGELDGVVRVQRDAVLLDVELGGTIVEHERGFRAERQLVLGVRFPAGCYWCGDGAVALVPGRRWRAACERCSVLRFRSPVTCSAASGLLGVSVDFGELPHERDSIHRFGRARAAGMWALTYVPLVAAQRAGASSGVVGVAALAAAGSLLLAAMTWRAPAARRHLPLFVGQCALLTSSSVVLSLA